MKKAKQLDIIGPKTTVSFSKLGIFDVPSKVDTGADSSSVWASNIIEKDGVLTFELFDPQSPWYNGSKVSTRQYHIRSIKNSFGKSEFRYKVPLNIEIAGKKVRARFTLSDRSNNRYPVLIGRRTLKDRFIVDVSLEDDEPVSVLMLSTKKTGKTEEFARNITSHGQVNVTYASYDDLCFETGGGKNAIYLIETGKDIASFDAVHFKTFSRHQDIASSAARYLYKRNIPFFDTAIKNLPGTSKLYQYIALTDAEINVPPSVFYMPESLPKHFKNIEARVGLPFILKDIHGDRGEHNYLIKSAKDFDKITRKMKKNYIYCIAQSYIENDQDFRVLVFGKRISLIIERSRKSAKTHLNNTSQGANSSLVSIKELPAKVQQACITAAAVMERQVAGVDMVKDKTSGMWYCLEINDGPQLASGSFVSEKHTAFSEFLHQELRK